ncbi:MAG: hypothetical protein AB4426_01340 [Xenococcaceae cyanobacterium]
MTGVGRQYMGEIGKTDNGIVVVTTHLYDGAQVPLTLFQTENAHHWGLDGGYC